MKFSAFLARYARLLGIGLLSLLLHLGALTWFELPEQRADHALDSPPLAVRIAHAEASTPAARAAPAPTRPAPAAPAVEPAAATEAAAPLLAPLQSSAASDVMPGAMPGQFRVSPAPPARIDYHTSDGGSARLAWHTDGRNYRIEIDGILGELDSEGGLDDGGLAPLRASEPAGPGRATTEFDRARGVIVSQLGARRAQLAGGAQDRASLLLQLAGMGRANPDQLRGVLSFWIGGAGGAREERYEVMGRETIDTGIGAVETLHLAQLAPEGAPRLELWLAPSQDWLPVQLRLTMPDGAVRTQTLAALDIERAPGT